MRDISLPQEYMYILFAEDGKKTPKNIMKTVNYWYSDALYPMSVFKSRFSHHDTSCHIRPDQIKENCIATRHLDNDRSTA